MTLCVQQFALTYFFISTGNPCDTNSIPIISLDINTIANVVMDPRESPPKAIVDATPLQAAMDKNKECTYLNRVCVSVFVVYLLSKHSNNALIESIG
jgi:hypothetical protein